MLKDGWKKIGDNRIAQGIIGFAGFLALSSTMSVLETQGRESVAYSNSFLSFFLAVLCIFCYMQVRSKIDRSRKEDRIIGAIYALCLSLALVLGKELETVESLQITKIGIWINWLVLSLFFTPFVRFVWQWLEGKGHTCTALSHQVFFRQKSFWINTLIIFLCWIPVFLAFYPGAFVYDAADEYIQVATRTFTTHHPLLHVLILGGFVAGGNRFFDSFNLGIAAYTLIQMLVLAGIFSYTIVWIKRRGTFGWMKNAALLFYGFFPLIPMYAVCSAKDGLFTAAFLVVVLQMLSLFEEPEGFFKKKGNVAASILAAAVMMLLRNNGFYAYLVWAALALPGLLFLTKQNRSLAKKNCLTAAGMFVGSLALYLLVFGGLVGVLNADASAKQEMMTVPIQQMVRTYNYRADVYDEEEKQILFELFPEEELVYYNPRLSDFIKSKFNNDNFNENPVKYLALWLQNGLEAPMTYLNAWLMTSYGYWYPDAVVNVYKGNRVHTFTYEESSYFGFETEYPGTRESKFPWLEEEYRKLSLELYQQRVPGLSMLFSPGFAFWVFAFCMGFFLRVRRLETVFPMLLILLLWMTALLGPTYLVRYVLILWFALPVIVSRVKV